MEETKTIWQLAKEHFICEHSNFEIRSLTMSNGGIQYKKQCMTCGEVFSNPLKHSAIFHKESVKPIDEELKNRRWQTMSDKAKEISSQRGIEWHTAHENYLQSPEWKSKRLLILHRDNYTCQRCQCSAAEVVHHITYQNLGNEYDYELVSLCHHCHDIIHGRATDE